VSHRQHTFAALTAAAILSRTRAGRGGPFSVSLAVRPTVHTFSVSAVVPGLSGSHLAHGH